MEILLLQILWTWICINLIWLCYWQAQLSLHIFYPIIFHDIQNTSLDYYLQKLIYSFRIAYVDFQLLLLTQVQFTTNILRLIFTNYLENRTNYVIAL